MKVKQVFITLFIAGMPFAGFSQTLSDAISKKDTVTALQLIKGGANINAVDANGTSPLMSACRWADEAMVGFLLRHGANPGAPKSLKGRTPLMIACAYYGGKGICDMLIAKGADINAAAIDGTTALMLAAQNAKLDVVDLLLKKGAKANTKDGTGKTALDYVRSAKVDDYLKSSVKDTRIDQQGVIDLLLQAMK